MVALMLEILLGFLTFTASLMAFGKLQEILPTRPITYKGQNIRQPARVCLCGDPWRLRSSSLRSRRGCFPSSRDCRCCSGYC